MARKHGISRCKVMKEPARGEQTVGKMTIALGRLIFSMKLNV
jgi:hypothetical protein